MDNGALDSIRSMISGSIENNNAIRTICQTSEMLFTKDTPITIWSSTLDILNYDIKSVDSVIMNVISEDDDNEAVWKLVEDQIEIFKDMLGVDIESELKISHRPLRLPMFELYSNNNGRYTYVDPKVIPDIESENDVRFAVPIDYFLVEKPLLFTDDIVIAHQLDTTEFMSNLDVLINILPYTIYTKRGSN